MTDFAVYLRAAWAVRSESDIYTVTDENGWHYHYPPLLAIVLVPFADPPPGFDRAGILPFGVSVAFWYILNVALLFWGLHRLASILELRLAAKAALEGHPTPTAGSEAMLRRVDPMTIGLALRLLPLLICLAPVGHTLMRGQVSVILFFLMVEMIHATARHKRWRSGFWLAGAICLKIIPAFLLIYPLWRRDWRSLGGCVVGCALGGV